MSCGNWDPDSNFCIAESKTVNPDELADCIEVCQFYTPTKQIEKLYCESCGGEYEFDRKRAIEVGSEELAQCPICGHVNLKIDDERLCKGLE